MAFVRLQDKAAERRKRGGGGIITLEFLWKKPTFSGKVQHPRRSSLVPYWVRTSEAEEQKLTQRYVFFHKAFFFDLAKSDTTSLLRDHSAACSQLSGKDRKKTSLNQFFTHKPLACARVQHQLFVRLSVQAGNTFHYIHSHTACSKHTRIDGK